MIEKINSFLQSSIFFGLLLSIVAYFIGILLRKKLKLSIFNPLLVAIIIIISTLLIFKTLKINYTYDDYKESANILSYLITPATVALAIPLYEKINLLKKNLKAILIGITSGVLTSLLSIYYMSLLFKIDKTIYATLLPKSITTAIGMGLSNSLGGIETITVAAIIITGVFGGIIADFVLKLFKIKNEVAIGIALGTSAHVIGTSKAMAHSDTEGAMASLSICISGIITLILANLFIFMY